MSLSKFFIDRPIFAGVISVLIFLGGLIMAIGEFMLMVPEEKVFLYGLATIIVHVRYSTRELVHS